MRQMVLPSGELLVRLESEGKIRGGGFVVGERAVTFIAEVESNEELDALLYEMPFWWIVKTKVTPLERFEDRHERDQRFTEQMESSLSGGPS